MAVKQDKPSDVLRQAIRDSGVMQKELCRRHGIDTAVLSRFMQHKGGLSMVSIDALAPALGLALVQSKGRKRRKGGKGQAR